MSRAARHRALKRPVLRISREALDRLSNPAFLLEITLKKRGVRRREVLGTMQFDHRGPAVRAKRIMYQAADRYELQDRAPTKYEYWTQPTSWSCFPTAVYNAHVYFGLECPNMVEMIKTAGCVHGGTHNEKGLLKMSHRLLTWRRGSMRDAFKQGGIITIWSRKTGLHVAFVFTHERKRYIVNAGVPERWAVQPYDRKVHYVQIPRQNKVYVAEVGGKW